MPTNNKSRTQPTSGALTRKEIEEIATQAAYKEVIRLLGDEPPATFSQPDEKFADALMERAVPDTQPILVNTPPVTIIPPVQTGERRFVAHLPHKDGGLPEQVHGTRNMETGQVVLDDAQGVYRSWVDFLNACHASGQTPTEIKDEVE